MSDLIFIIGPPASDKAAVGLSLSQLTGFRFFHNHMTAEPVAALFGWGTHLYGEVATELRLSLRRKIEECMNAILKSTTGMCPKCRGIRNLEVKTERLETRTAGGVLKTLEIVATHCETCGSFISRESRDVVDPTP